ncbi:MAG: tyrosine-type recombinase/integrase, partial [bacterium]|nr:tyrosine-type recombinase/integrase [bacterium]
TAPIAAPSPAGWIVPTIGNVRLDRLNPGHVRAVTTAVTDAGRTTTTARAVHVTLTQMIQAARAEGHTIADNVVMVDAPRVATNDRTAIPLDQIATLIATAATTEGGVRFHLALLYPTRQMEILGLTREALDLDSGILDISWQLQALPYVTGRSGPFRIPEGYEARHLTGAWHLVRPKTASSRRTLSLSPDVAGALRLWQAEAPANPWGLLFTESRPDRRGNARPMPVDPKSDTAAWKALQDLAGVRHPSGRYWHLHEARHGSVTAMRAAGVDEATVMQIAGHTSAAVNRRYDHVSIERQRAAFEATARAITAAAPPPDAAAGR